MDAPDPTITFGKRKDLDGQMNNTISYAKNQASLNSIITSKNIHLNAKCK